MESIMPWTPQGLIFNCAYPATTGASPVIMGISSDGGGVGETVKRDPEIAREDVENEQDEKEIGGIAIQ